MFAVVVRSAIVTVDESIHVWMVASSRPTESEMLSRATAASAQMLVLKAAMRSCPVSMFACNCSAYWTYVRLLLTYTSRPSCHFPHANN